MNKVLKLLSIRRILDYRCISNKITADGKELPKAIKKEVLQNRITLLGTDNSVSITDLKNAQNLSNKRELKLVKIQDVDAKTRRPVYKLMTTAEFYEEELLNRKQKKETRQTVSKGNKLITLSSRISEHDLMTRIKQILKLIDRRYEVRVVVAGEGEEEGTKVSEKVYSIIESNVKTVGKVVQKVTKRNNLKFQILPLTQNSQTGTDSSDADKKSESNNTGPL